MQKQDWELYRDLRRQNLEDRMAGRIDDVYVRCVRKCEILETQNPGFMERFELERGKV